MRIPLFITMCYSLLLLSCSSDQNFSVDTISNPNSILDYIDPFIGTGGHGHTFPGATTPFGMVQCSPQTRLTGWDGCSGYHFSDNRMYGFAHTALSGTGVSDYGDVLLFPYEEDTELLTNEHGQVFSNFQKSSESAGAGWYSVELDSRISVELTATPRSGIHRYTFPGSGIAAVLIDLNHRDRLLDHQFKILNDTTILGRRVSAAWASEQHVYFAIRFSAPFTKSTITPDSLKLALNFDNLTVNVLECRVGLSAVSADGALNNLVQETDARSFAELKQAAAQLWQMELEKVKIQTPDQNKARIFYTALYHSFIAPNLFNDVDGRYRGMDLQIHKLESARSQYTVFSLWDTYRATHPLYTILQPQRNTDFINTMLDQYRTGGILPIWELAGNYTGCMIGYHGIPVIWDAYEKNQTEFDAELAFEAMKHSANQTHLGLDNYRDVGFISADQEGESVSKTLEYAYDDWCIAQLAQALGKDDEYQYFIQRSQYWRNVFDPETGFMRARFNGGWFGPFDPWEVNFNYTEANAWQYRFYAPHDLDNLISEMGGFEEFESELDRLFTASSATTGRHQSDITGLIGQYAHGNEPSHHLAYLYNYVGKPWKTQIRVREILDELYSANPDGLSGNEDCGQMSSWLVFSALGFYPVCPGDGKYIFGSPWFDKAVINIGDDRNFVIEAHNNDKQNKFIQSVELNSKPYDKSYLKHSSIIAGDHLVFQMDAEPNLSFGNDINNRPNNSVNEQYLQPPYVINASSSFSGSMDLMLGSHQTEVDIYYQLHYDDSGSRGSAPELYTQPIMVDRSGRIEFWSQHGDSSSAHIISRFNGVPAGRSLTLYSNGIPAGDDKPYANQYAAGGDRALIDGVVGRGDFKTGTWQGYQGRDLEALVDLGELTEISSVEINFLQDENSWIFMPDSVIIQISEDGTMFSTRGELSPQTEKRDSGSIIENFRAQFRSTCVRYVKVLGQNIINCPDWHKSAGGDCWIFADEIVIN